MSGLLRIRVLGRSIRSRSGWDSCRGGVAADGFVRRFRIANGAVQRNRRAVDGNVQRRFLRLRGDGDRDLHRKPRQRHGADLREHPVRKPLLLPGHVPGEHPRGAVDGFRRQPLHGAGNRLERGPGNSHRRCILRLQPNESPSLRESRLLRIAFERLIEAGRRSRGDRILRGSMTVPPPKQLGPYELLGLLGAGGMGDVYRARDTRLQRDVAVKVLPPRLSSDPALLDRFEREARSASALNHPNIVTIYEIGKSDSTSFIVMELVDGKTLRDLLHTGPLSLRKLLSTAGQLADGLAKAHAAGIVHRDLKPENVMVTSDGLVKILDFGLAKLTHPGSDRGESEEVRTIAGETEPGLVMGTVGYMSPEQATGQPVDFRSDQFSFGSILYEMVTGKRAFDRATTPETLAAIIREEPEPLPLLNPRAPSYLGWIDERCLAKEPHDRYAATEDLARELETLREHVTDLSTEIRLPFEPPRRRRRWGAIALATALLAFVAGVYWIGQWIGQSRNTPPRFRQLTFRGDGISTARFAPDGQTVVYAAQSEGKPPELFTARLDSPETRSLGLPAADILSISTSGEMALLLAPRLSSPFRAPHSDVSVDPSRLRGTLAEASLAGGPPRELLENVYSAEWGPDGKSLAVVRYVEGKNRIEFPQGRLLREGSAPPYPRISISPSGARVAFAAFLNLYVTEPGGGVRDLH